MFCSEEKNTIILFFNFVDASTVPDCPIQMIPLLQEQDVGSLPRGDILWPWISNLPPHPRSYLFSSPSTHTKTKTKCEWIWARRRKVICIIFRYYGWCRVFPGTTKNQTKPVPGRKNELWDVMITMIDGDWGRGGGGLWWQC